MLIIEEKNLGEESTSQSKGNYRHFTPTLVEFKVEIEVVAAKVLVDQQSKISNRMICNSNKTEVEEDTLEARGVQEVVDIRAT